MAVISHVLALATNIVRYKIYIKVNLFFLCALYLDSFSSCFIFLRVKAQRRAHLTISTICILNYNRWFLVWNKRYCVICFNGTECWWLIRFNWNPSDLLLVSTGGQSYCFWKIVLRLRVYVVYRHFLFTRWDWLSWSVRLRFK